MKCKNLKHRPKNKVVREILGSVDNCEHFKKIKGLHLSAKRDTCVFQDICKHYIPENE